MKWLVVASLTFTLLLFLAPVSQAQTACQAPGAGNTADYPYDSAANTYLICSILSAQATIMAYTPTPTPTLLPTPAAVAAETGCSNYGNPNTYQTCVIEDSTARSNAYTFWAIPAIFFAVIIFGVVRHGARGKANE